MSRRVYTCTVCGKEEPWGESWGRYSSIALDETCPDDVPYSCSEECAAEVMLKVKKGEWRLPVLRMEGMSGYGVSVSKHGY